MEKRWPFLFVFDTRKNAREFYKKSAPKSHYTLKIFECHVQNATKEKAVPDSCGNVGFIANADTLKGLPKGTLFADAVRIIK